MTANTSTAYQELRDMLESMNPEDAPNPEVLVRRLDDVVSEFKAALGRIQSSAHLVGGRHEGGWEYIDLDSLDRFIAEEVSAL